MKAKTSTAKKTKAANLAGLKAKKEALERGERAAARVFKFETQSDGGLRREMLDPEAYRRKIARE